MCSNIATCYHSRCCMLLPLLEATPPLGARVSLARGYSVFSSQLAGNPAESPWLLYCLEPGCSLIDRVSSCHGIPRSASCPSVAGTSLLSRQHCFIVQASVALHGSGRLATGRLRQFGNFCKCLQHFALQQSVPHTAFITEVYACSHLQCWPVHS